VCFFFSSRRRHTRSKRDWSSDVCSSDLAPTADGSREGKLTLKIAGVPASAEGTCTLTAVSEESSTLTYDGDVNVSIPLFGGKIERAAVNAVERVMRLERDVDVEWLARR